MSGRLVVLVLAAVFALAACGKSGEAPKAPEPKAPAAEKAPAPAAPAAPAPAKAPEPAAAKPEEAAKEPAAEEAASTVDRDKLGRTYQDVYCAQKKGEMDKILGLYKAGGFATPQEFTKAWIEAAKDTDWVTKIARDVAKKCQ
jgi:hypothetical protein